MGAVLVSKATPPGIHGVSVLMAGKWLGLQIRKTHDGHVNANRESIFEKSRKSLVMNIISFEVFCSFLLTCLFVLFIMFPTLKQL
jgi:hypothetical protein